MAQEGWICPRCGKVNAPWVMQCSCNMDTQVLPKVGAPYYKDTTSYLKVVINDGTGYTVTKITPGGKCIGIYQFNADNTNFLKYYKICSQSEWESAIDRLNIWFKDASLKIKKL